MDAFLIKSISLLQKKVKNIQIKEAGHNWTSGDQYIIKFDYKTTTLYLTYGHRDWKGKIIDQIVNEIDNKIKQFEEEKLKIEQDLQVKRILFALDIKLEIELRKSTYNKITSKPMEEKIAYITKSVKTFDRKNPHKSTYEEVYNYCMKYTYEKLIKKAGV